MYILLNHEPCVPLLSRLTVSCVVSMRADMVLVDINGHPHPFTAGQVGGMLATGWAAFLLSLLLNILFYKLHPSAVDFNMGRFANKCTIHILGHKMHLFRFEGKGFL